MTEESRGRPARKYPPRIDATPEELARVVLKWRTTEGKRQGPSLSLRGMRACVLRQTRFAKGSF